MANALRSDQTLHSTPDLFIDTDGSTANYNPGIVKSITLPNNQQYQLFYNSYGEVARVVLPTGAAFEYDYAAGLSDGYDANGNLLRKTDGRGVVTDYVYDVLNRSTSVNYSDTAANPDIARYYDNTINYGKGRFWFDYYYKDDGAIDHQAIDGYDPSGRVWVKRQVFYSGSAWYAYESRQTYDLAGDPKTIQYPSGHTVAYNYDVAGRLNDNGTNLAFTGNLGDGTSRNYSTGLSYDSWSHLKQEQFGTQTPLFHKQQFNTRGQLYDVRLSTLSQQTDTMNWNRGALTFFYSTQGGWVWGGSGSDNNGNVLLAQHWVPNNDQVSTYQWMNQYYSYDALNRITSVTEEQNAATTTGAQYYVYDRFGNRTIDQTQTWGMGIPKPNFDVDKTTNRLIPPSGTMAFDGAGNLTNDTFTGEGNRTYDAENRMTKAWANGQWQYYAYDADGHRTRRKVNGTEIWQVYGPSGELLAEYAAAAAAASPQKEYGYRSGQLLVTAEPGAGGGGGGGPQNVTWTNAVGVSVNGNSLTKTAAEGWGNAGASSTQAINSGDGYVEFTATENTTPRLCGLSHTDSDQNYSTIDFALAPYNNGALYIFESGSFFQIGFYSPGDTFRVAIEGGVVKYRQNGNLLYSSTTSPTYPLRADTSFYSNGATITNAVISGTASGGSSAQVHWLVTDHLGTPRMIVDQSGSLANTSRHDYLPFGEELGAGTGGRTTSQGYVTDSTRQKFTEKERDGETGLDYSIARYYSFGQGRFASPDDFLNDTHPTDPAGWNLYAYVRNNPLRYVDPEGEKIYVGAISNKTDRDELLRRANYTYGCNGCVSIDGDGFLAVDTSGLSQDVINATAYLTDAITSNDPAKLFSVEVTNDSAEVAFGDSRAGSAGVQLPGNKFRSSAIRIRLDFGDDKWVTGNNQAKEAFLNLVFAHEVAHFAPNYVHDPDNGRKTGPVVDAVNKIQQARGLLLRAHYSAFGRDSHGVFVSVDFGIAKRDSGGNVTSNRKTGGIEVKRTNKMITWIKSTVGGTGIN